MPAGYVKPEVILRSMDFFHEHGYLPVVFPDASVESCDFYHFAAPDAIRAEAFEAAVVSDCAAIWCVRGGYGCIRIAESLQKSMAKLAKKPKWLIGFSDITFLHGLAHQQGLLSIHGPMPNAVWAEGNDHSYLLKNILELISQRDAVTISYEMPFFEENRKNNVPVSGRLIGGNLSLLVNTIGTPYQMDYNNSILFIEEVGEPLYKIDRMLHHLYWAGCLSSLAGLVIGDMDKDSVAIRAIFSNLLKKPQYPMAFGLSVGHITDNQPVLHSAWAELHVTTHGSTLQMMF